LFFLAESLGAFVRARNCARRPPDGTLAQVMRGILFPNANLLFDGQPKDPGVIAT